MDFRYQKLLLGKGSGQLDLQLDTLIVLVLVDLHDVAGGIGERFLLLLSPFQLVVLLSPLLIHLPYFLVRLLYLLIRVYLLRTFLRLHPIDLRVDANLAMHELTKQFVMQGRDLEVIQLSVAKVAHPKLLAAVLGQSAPCLRAVIAHGLLTALTVTDFVCNQSQGLYAEAALVTLLSVHLWFQKECGGKRLEEFPLELLVDW